MKPTLEELAIRFCCDKYFRHSYIGVYETLLRELAQRLTIRKVLEIGIGYADLMKPFVPQYIHGASLKMWRDYFPEATIYGIDNNYAAVRDCYHVGEGEIRSSFTPKDPRILCYQVDQSKPLELLEFLNQCGGEFDFVVDDGSHKTSDQIVCAKTLLPYLSRGGLYVIEDVLEPEKVAYALNGKAYILGKHFDDNLVIIWR